MRKPINNNKNVMGTILKGKKFVKIIVVASKKAINSP